MLPSGYRTLSRLSLRFFTVLPCVGAIDGVDTEGSSNLGMFMFNEVVTERFNEVLQFALALDKKQCPASGFWSCKM